jgi:hypothetical protein
VCFFILERSIQFGFGVWTSAITDGNGVRLLFRHSPRRVSRTTRLSAPEHHRYVRFLDWKVAGEVPKTNYGGGIRLGSY